jgi:Protein of unknown function (DUF3108)
MLRGSLALLLALLPAAAQGGVPQGGLSQGGVSQGGVSQGAPSQGAVPRVADARLDYEAYAHGLPVLHLQVGLAMWPGGYQVQLGYRTVGLVGFFYRGRQQDTVAGTWHDGRPAPRRFTADGVWHGDPHRLVMDYADGRPELRTVVPPLRAEREPVPPARQLGTIDTLSALVDLLRQVARTGSCVDRVETFDGRRLSEIAARNAGTSQLQPRAGAVFAGPALRCDFTGRMQAGFLYGHQQRDSRPLHGSAWFAALVPGGQPWPVRMRFETDWFGDMTMVLTGAQLGPPALTAERGPPAH